MKTILSILFLFVCAFAHAQYHNVEGIRVVGRSDSTTISNVGQIQFDADDDKFRFNDGTGWFSFLKEGSVGASWPLSGTADLTGDVNIGGASTHDVTIGTSFDRAAIFRVNASDDITLNRQVAPDGTRSTFKLGSELVALLRGNYLGDTPEQRIQAEGDSLYIFVGQGTLSENFLRLVFRPDSGLLYEDSTANNYGIRYGGVITPTDSTLITKAYVDGAVSSGALGIKHQRVTTGSINASTSAAVTITWANAFADANYTVNVSVVEADTDDQTLIVDHIESISASQVVVRVVNEDAVSAKTGTLHVIAIHD